MLSTSVDSEKIKPKTNTPGALPGGVSPSDQNVRSQELPTNYYDLVLSNVPFGDYPVFDPWLVEATGNPRLNKRIHNYFFAKALQHVRPGGIVAFITSVGTLNARDAVAMDLRRHIASQADLMAAFRLPQRVGQSVSGLGVPDALCHRAGVPLSGPVPPRGVAGGEGHRRSADARAGASAGGCGRLTIPREAEREDRKMGPPGFEPGTKRL
ncbi:MAG: hypothetical protein KatS3mg024_0968 [Armatimonadota bacterium]|nr:MAG: hypothetical protein KatS3mg024_0968 [Armatimonadota bacterium]